LQSVPLQPTVNTVQAIYGDDITGYYWLYNYNQAGGGYSYLSPTSALTFGRGYWLLLTQPPATIDVSGVPEVDSAFLALYSGWNIIGDAIPMDLPKFALNIKQGTNYFTFAQAVLDSLISPTLFVGDSTIADTLAPWGGYWLQTLENNLQLVTFQPAPGMDLDIPQPLVNFIPDPETDWSIALKLIRGTISNQLSQLGVNSRAREGYDLWFDAEIPPVSPSGNYVRAVFEHSGWNAPVGDDFCRDIKTSFNEKNRPQKKEWTFTVESSSNGAMTVEFLNITEILPEGYSAVAIWGTQKQNLLTNNIIPLNYTAPQYITVKIFNVPATLAGWADEILNGNLPTEYALEKIYPNPFNPVTTIRIALPEASNLKVIVYNILGKEAASLADGYYPAGYHNLEFDAGNLTSGVYLVKAEVLGRMKEMRKVMLIK
jgi:hypothetical protein